MSSSHTSPDTLQDTNAAPSESETSDADTSSTDTINPGDGNSCQPSCEEKDCGGDGCGGSCGVCAQDFKCEAGFCMELCSPQASTICVSQDVYWADSCGVMGLLKTACETGTTCENGECLPCLFAGAVQCDGNDIIEVDNCGNTGEIMESCPPDTLCLAGECLISEHPLSGTYSIEVTPSEMVLGDGETTHSFSPNQVQIIIDGAGTTTLQFTGHSNPLPPFSGTYQNIKLEGWGEYEEELNQSTYPMSANLTLLFSEYQDNTLIQGTIQHLVQESTDEAPTSLTRDMSGIRIATD